MSRKAINVTLAVRATGRWPFFAVRAIGPRTRMGVGELAVPIVLDFDADWLERRTAKVFVTVPTPEAPTVKVDVRSE